MCTPRSFGGGFLAERMKKPDGGHHDVCGSHCFRPGYAAAQSSDWGANYFPNVPVVCHQDGKTLKFLDDVVGASACFREVTVKIGKMVFAAMFAIGLGSSCAYAQTAATFTAVVAQVNTAAGTISLTQSTDSATATADYQADPVLLSNATVGATVQAMVQMVNGNLAVVGLQTPNGTFYAMPQAAASSTPAVPTAPNPAVSNPARLTPLGVLQ